MIADILNSHNWFRFINWNLISLKRLIERLFGYWFQKNIYYIYLARFFDDSHDLLDIYMDNLI